MVCLIAYSLLQSAATTPVSRTDAWWQERHIACVNATKKGGIDVAFIGDSITQGWESSGRAAWDASFAPLKAANFGFSGDRTQHVLWRIQNGEVTAANPKVIVMMIGTNNLAADQPAQVAEGVCAIVDELLAKTRAKILLLGIFPRAEAPENPLRLAAAEATRLFYARLHNPRVNELDIGKSLTRTDGTLRMLLLPDALHLNAAGYSIWAKAILPTVRKLLMP